MVKRDYFIIFLKTYGYNLSGKIVGVVLLNEKSSLNSGRMLDVKFSARSSRWLEEVGSLDPTKMPEVRLVRRTLAWITGLILLISTLIGVRLPLLMGFTYFLCSSSDKVIKNALLFFGEHWKLSEFLKYLVGIRKEISEFHVCKQFKLISLFTQSSLQNAYYYETHGPKYI